MKNQLPSNEKSAGMQDEILAGMQDEILAGL